MLLHTWTTTRNAESKEIKVQNIIVVVSSENIHKVGLSVHGGDSLTMASDASVDVAIPHLPGHHEALKEFAFKEFALTHFFM